MTVVSSLLQPGDVVIALFPEHLPPGHEQQGVRPAVVVGFPEKIGTPRFPVVLVTPLTTYRGQTWAARSPHLYPSIQAGTAGLPMDSLVLLDQVRTLDQHRIRERLGTLPAELYQPIREALREMLD